MTAGINVNVASGPCCLRCGRPLTSSRSINQCYGSECLTAILTAATTADLSAWSTRQIDDARELIRAGAIVLDRVWRNPIFRSVSTDGLAYHLTTRQACSCIAGVNGHQCYHRAAVEIILTSWRELP